MFKKTDWFRLLLAAEAVAALVVLLTCFQREERIYTVFGDEIEGQTVETGEGREFSGERMELSPGVYQVRMETALGEGETVFAQIKCDQAYFKALRNNEVAALPGSTEMKFNVYVVDKVSTAYLFCRFSGADTGALRGLSIYRTGMGNRMLLFVLLLLFAAADFLVIFRRRVLSGRVTVKRQVVFWVMTAGILIAYFPYLTDYFSLGDDMAYHLGRIVYLKAALEEGVLFPVRMQGTWLYGHGYATSLFYGDLFLYFPALLMLLGFSVMTSYKIFALAVTAAGGWLAYRCLYRCVKEEYAALFGSMLYLLAPYRILDFYSRCAVGEYLAMTFLPLICCGMYLLYSEAADAPDYHRHKWYIVWGMSALLQSHLITSEMTAALMAAVCALFWRKTFRRRTFLQLAEAVGIVLLINMWFWLPMLYMMRGDLYQFQTVIQEEMVKGTTLASVFQLLPNKGGVQTGVWNGEPLQIGVGALFLLLIYFLWRIRGHRAGKACRIFALLSVLAVVLSTTYIPWNAVRELPVIGYFVGSIQFPFRWMAPAAALTAFFSAFFLLEAQKGGGLRMKLSTGIAALLVVMSAVYHVNDCAFQATPVFLYNMENLGTVGIGSGEWLLDGTDTDELHYHEPAAEEGLTWRRYEKKGTSVDISLENMTSETRYLELPLFGYQGYEVAETEGEGGAAPVIAQERGAHNDLRIAIPAEYKGRIQVSWKGFTLFDVSGGGILCKYSCNF